MLTSLLKGHDQNHIRVEFADDLHLSDFFAQALEIVEIVLADEADSIAARVLKGDILVHLERNRESEPLLLEVVAEDVKCDQAWVCLADIYHQESRWPELLWVTDAQLELDIKNWQYYSVLRYRARALFGVGKYREAKSIAEKLSQSPILVHQVISKALDGFCLLAQQEVQKALNIAEKQLQKGANGRQSYWNCLFEAIVFQASLSLGQDPKPLEEEAVLRVKQLGLEAVGLIG